MSTGFTTVSASRLQDATGTVVTNATIYFTPVDNSGKPVSFRTGGTIGQAKSQAVSATVSNGAFSLVLADTSLTSPVNIGYSVQVIDNVTGNSLLGPGYTCVQPTGSSWSFDGYTPNLAGQITVQTGPTGPQGAPGSVGPQGAPGPAGPAINFRGPYDPTIAYSTGDGITKAEASGELRTYVSRVANNHGVDPDSTGLLTVGDMTAPTTASTTSGVAIKLNQALPAGALLSIEVILTQHTAGGTLTFFLVTNNTDGTTTVNDSFTVTPAGTGDQTYTAGVDFAARNVTAGQHLAYYSTTETVGYSVTTGTAFDYLVGMPSGTQTWANSSGFSGISSFPIVVKVQGPSGAANWSLVLTSPASQTTEQTNEAYLVSGGRTLLENEKYTGSAIPAGWVTQGSGAWTMSSGLLSPSSGSAYASRIISPKLYAAERRTYRFRFELMVTGTVVCVASWMPSLPENTDLNFGSSILFDAVNDLLVIQNAWTSTSGDNPGTSQSVALGFVPTLNTPYTMEIAVNRREVTVSVWDSVSGTKATLTSGSNATSTGYYQWQGAAAGLMLDQLCYRWVSGQFKVLEHWVYADAKRPRLYIAGDSITQGYGLALSQRWSQIVASAVGNTVISGRSGCNSDELVARLHGEISALKPEYVLVMIGTNDLSGGNIGLTALQNNYDTIVSQCLALGIKVVGCTLPPAAGRTGISSFNSWLLARTDLAGIVRFDRATDSSLFQGDGVHPSVAGGAALALYASEDVPFLFDGTALGRQMADWLPQTTGTAFTGALSGSKVAIALTDTDDGVTSYFGTYPSLFQFSFNRRPSDGVVSNGAYGWAFVNVSGTGFAFVFQNGQTMTFADSGILQVPSVSVATGITGPVTAPTGSCTGREGQWVFSQDGHATFGDPTTHTWIAKI